MSYRNKTYVAFASEDIKFYRLMEAWKANEKIDGITAYFAISKTILKTIPDNTVQLQNLSKCTPPANALSNEKKVKNRIPYLNIPSKNDIHNAITVLIATSIAISNPNLHTS